MSMYTFAAGIVGTIFAIWCSYQYMGRRPMILFGTAGAVVCMFAAALGGTIAPGSPEASKNFMAWNVIYSVVYGGFAATIAWPISAEVVSSRLRVLTLSVATGIDYIFACKSASSIRFCGLIAHRRRAHRILLPVLHQPEGSQLGHEILLAMGGQ